MPKSLLIENIRNLVLGHQAAKPLRGGLLGELPQLENAFLLVEGGRIAAYGDMAQCPERADEKIDATDRLVMPAWCDSHTHLVFAGSREGEFVDRLRGLSYEEIARRGGGILNSAERLRSTPEEVLVEQALGRLKEIMRHGTGAVEIKSGYGLSLEGELKMLRVIRRLKELSPLAIKATFLGAHALPPEYKNDRRAYIDLVVKEMLPAIANEGLADYIDVFCEKVAFSVAETETILEAGARYGLRPKIHVNQFNAMGGIAAALRHDALSVDHLEVVEDAEMDALAASDTIATLLPSAPFFLDDPYPPARKLVDKGVAVALATDYNPGSSPSGRMPFVLSLACIKTRLTPEEAINAATLNGACALEWQHELGSIAPGKRANCFVTKKIPSFGYIPYAFGSDFVERVIFGNGGKHIVSQY
jgi:imidazolonepropionase